MSERLKAERVALEIMESIAKGEFEDLTPWKPKKVTHSREGILEALYSLLEVDHNATGVIKWLERYDGEIRGKREAKRFIEWIPVATTTKKRYFTCLRKVEELKELFSFSIKPKKDEKRKEIDPFTDEEIKKIKGGMKDDHYEGLMLFMLHTGCRTSEAIGIRWKDIEFENNRIRFAESLARVQRKPGQRKRKNTKNGKIRFTPLSDELKEYLEAKYSKWLLNPVYDSNGNEDLIFLSPEGSFVNDQNFRNRSWEPLLKRLGIRYRSPYNLRHTFISHCLRKGVDVVTVAYWVGNSPEVIYKHYAGMIDAVPLPKLF
jgi:integrase